MRAVAIGTQQRLSEVLDARMDSACDGQDQADTATTPACQGRVWVQLTASSLSISGPQGLDTDGYGVLVGTDAKVDDAVRIGVEGGAGQIRSSGGPSGNRVHNVHAGVYAVANTGPVVFSATVDALHSAYRVRRQTGIGPAEADPSGSTVSAGLQAAWPFALGIGKLTPAVGVLYQRQRLDRFQEQVDSSNPLATSFGVSGASTRANVVQPYAQLTYSGVFRSGGMSWVPHAQLGYLYQANHAYPAVQVMAQDGTVFALPGTDVGRGMGTVAAGIGVQFAPGWHLDVDYRGLFARKLHDNALSVNFTKQF